MFNPKKTIPKLAVAMLALTGCSGDDGDGGGGSAGNGMGGDGGNGGTGGAPVDFDASLNAFCTNVAPCIQDATVQGCINYYNELNDYNDNAQCTAAQISYFDCGATKTCNEITVDFVCDPEYYAMLDVCDPVRP